MQILQSAVLESLQWIVPSTMIEVLMYFVSYLDPRPYIKHFTIFFLNNYVQESSAAIPALFLYCMVFE